MHNKSRTEVVDRVMRKYKLVAPNSPAPRQDAVDAAGHTYHIKYRTVGKLSSLSFDFLPDELAADYDYFLGVFVDESGNILEAFQLRRTALPDMVNETQDSFRLRWNDATRADPRVEPR